MSIAQQHQLCRLVWPLNTAELRSFGMREVKMILSAVLLVTGFYIA